MRRFSKYVSVDINTEVDVDMSSDTVIDFLKQCSTDEVKEIYEKSKAKIPLIQNATENTIRIQTLDDISRFEILADAFKKYDIFELERRLK